MKRVMILALVVLFLPVTTFAQLICKQAPAGIVSWWDGEGDANDIVGTNHGSLENGATAAQSGRVGTAFAFDGVNDFVKVPNAASLNFVNRFTVEFWVKGDPTNPMNDCCQGLVTTDFYGVEGFDADRAIGVFISTDGGTTFPNANTVSSNTGFGLIPGQWHHVAGVYDGSTLGQYVDGRLRAAIGVSGDIPPMLINSFLSFGSEDGRTYNVAATANRYFHGLIDEIAIYSRALSAAEIRGIYAAADQGKCKGVPFANFVASLSVNLGQGSDDDTFELRISATQGQASDGINPITESVGVRLGAFSLVIPAGSFAGERPKFKGTISGIKIDASFSSVAENSFDFRIKASGADLTGIVSPTEIELAVGDNGAVTTPSQTQIKGKGL